MSFTSPDFYFSNFSVCQVFVKLKKLKLSEYHYCREGGGGERWREGGGGRVGAREGERVGRVFSLPWLRGREGWREARGWGRGRVVGRKGGRARTVATL
jgi:hypothetical protein